MHPFVVADFFMTHLSTGMKWTGLCYCAYHTEPSEQAWTRIWILQASYNWWQALCRIPSQGWFNRRAHLGISSRRVCQSILTKLTCNEIHSSQLRTKPLCSQHVTVNADLSCQVACEANSILDTLVCTLPKKWWHGVGRVSNQDNSVTVPTVEAKRPDRNLSWAAFLSLAHLRLMKSFGYNSLWYVASRQTARKCKK